MPVVISGTTGIISPGMTANGLMTMGGRATVATNLTVSGNTTFGASGKTQTSTGAWTHTGTKSISTNLTVSGNATISGVVSGPTSISDTLGNVRLVPQNSQTGAYALLATDAGKHISITTGGITVNQNIFNVGDVVSIFNNSASTQTITQGASVTLRLVGTTTTGNRTIAAYGLATILCVASNVFVVTGVT